MCIKLVTRFFIVALLSASQFFCPIQTWAQLNYTFERLNSENGLPTNAIKGLQFDAKNRFLWVATESGIVRYNGYSFQNFGDISNNDNLNGRIVFFERANNGTLFGKLIDESVFKIQNNKAVIDKATKRMKSQKDFITFKYSLPYLNSKDQISLVDYSTFKIGDDIYFINYDFKVQQLKRIINGTVEKVATFQNGAQGFMMGDRWFLIQNDGSILEVKKGIAGHLEFKTGYHIDLPNLDLSNQFFQLKVFQNHPSEQVYILQGTSLYSLQYLNNTFSIQLLTNQIPKFEFIRHLQVDNVTNTIYLGTDNRGVIVARPQYFKRIIPNNIIEGMSTSAYAQVQLSNGNIQINTGQIFGLNKNNAPTIFYKPSGTSTYMSSENKLYFTNSDGIIEYDLEKKQIVNISDTNNVNRNSFVEVNGSMYAMNEQGVGKKNSQGDWDLILKFTKTPFNFIVYQLAQINKNEILAATTDGLYKYNIQKNRFTIFYRDKSNANFRSIYNLGGYFLLGTYGGGVYMYKSDTIKQVPLDQNGYLKYTHCFIEDDQHRIWASTNKGIFMSPKQSLINFWHIGPGKIVYKYFGKLEGIDMLELNGGCTPCAIKLSDGQFSMPGIDGLIQFDPNEISDLNIIPNVFLDKVSVDGKLFNFSSTFNLPSKTKMIFFQLGVSGMLSQENIRLEYKLDETEFWNQLSLKDPVLKIENPSLGSHKVIVRVRSTFSSKWETQEFNFNITYPWFLHPFTYIFYLFLGFGFVLAYIRFKTLIYQRRQKILEAEVAVKTASLNKINNFLIKRNQAKDHVIAIMNHDVLTPLKYLHLTAKNVAEMSKDENVKKSITQIARTSKELEYLTSNMLNWVKFNNLESLSAPQIVDFYELVSDLLEFVKPFIQNDTVEIINNVPVGTMLNSWPDTLRVLLYNIIVNATNSTLSGTISIEYKLTTNGNNIIVKDTGIGMNNSMVQYLLTGNSEDGIENLPKYKKGNGVGFQIIRHIIKLMNASIKIDSKEGYGTTIIILLND